MIKKIINDNRGSAGVLTILFFLFFLISFSSLVIDAGIVYVARREMITAADAGALAGAKEMEKILGSSSPNHISETKENAISIAKAVAIENGADERTTVSIEKMDIRLSDGTLNNRNVLKVNAVSNKEMIFFKFAHSLGVDISAESVATWGFITKVTAGQLLPLYTTSDIFTDSNTLHDGKMSFNNAIFSNQRGFIYLDPQWNGQNVINNAIEGMPTKITLGVDSLFEGKPGAAHSVINSVENRMKKAQTLQNPKDRREYMFGLVPVVELAYSQGNKTFFQIKSFAVYEIIDIMTSNNRGSEEALLGDDYTKLGYKSTYNPSTNKGKDYDKGTIYGKFTGEIREVEVIIDKNDQIGNYLTITSGSKYNKLVQ